MRESILDSVTRVLRFQRSPDAATSQFRNWKHNADILPRLQQQLDVLLAAYGKFQHVTYDIQGIHDDGSDVVLHCRPEADETPPELICFQVKSFDDLTKKSYLQELKAQRDDSFRKIIGLEYYFLILCTDAKLHKERVRQIASEFRSADRTEVVEPGFAYTFLHHPRVRVDALIKRVMETDDLVFSRAMDSLDLSSRSARALAVYITIKMVVTGKSRFSFAELSRDSSLKDIYLELRERYLAQLEDIQQKSPSRAVNSTDPDEDADYDDEFYDEEIRVGEFDEQLAADFELISEGVTALDASSEDVFFLTDQMQALEAVALDALVRYEYSERELLAYMFNLTGIRD
jgi:hypothetical protein